MFLQLYKESNLQKAQNRKFSDFYIYLTINLKQPEMFCTKQHSFHFIVGHFKVEGPLMRFGLQAPATRSMSEPPAL